MRCGAQGAVPAVPAVAAAPGWQLPGQRLVVFVFAGQASGPFTEVHWNRCQAGDPLLSFPTPPRHCRECSVNFRAGVEFLG